MDPLTGLGLAANVLQFVDFAAEIVSKGNAIRKSTSGTLKDNAQLDIVCTRIQTLAADLEQSVNNPIAANDLALNAICRDCSQIAAEIIESGNFRECHKIQELSAGAKERLGERRDRCSGMQTATVSR
jgi:hypothetical protein